MTCLMVESFLIHKEKEKIYWSKQRTTKTNICTKLYIIKILIKHIYNLYTTKLNNKI